MPKITSKTLTLSRSNNNAKHTKESNNMKYTKRIALVILLALPFPAMAQTLEMAKILYKKGHYDSAIETFRKSLKSKPNDASLNQWYGVCLYMTGKKEDAIPYLKKAAQKKVQEAYYYLGKIYYENYDFDTAAGQFEQYREAIEKNGGDITPADRCIDMADRASGMLKRTEAVTVIDSLVVDKADFLRYYKLPPELCRLAYYGDIFRTDTLSEDATLYENQRQDKILYSRKTENGRYAIFERSRLNSDAWSEEQPLKIPVRDSANYACPFLLNDGLTLYYATDDDSVSIGGYDIFITRKNLNTGSYLIPENVGMPFNSPFNDYMMAIDEINGVGWFVSDRYQPDGKVAIYLFIPNEAKEIYTLPEEEIIPYAQIADLEKTWPEGADYAPLLEKIYNMDMTRPQKPKEEFVFVIKPGLIYTRKSDFKSAKAKELYEKSVSVDKEITDLYDELSELRLKYAVAKDKSAISANILKNEEYLLTLYPQPEKYRNMSRKAEIEYLDTQKQ